MDQNDQKVAGANARQIGGEHYKGGMEHWDIVVHHNLDYFQAQILRYVMRWKKKDGIKDLQKAQHFIEKYLELAVGGKLRDFPLPKPAIDTDSATAFITRHMEAQDYKPKLLEQVDRAQYGCPLCSFAATTYIEAADHIQMCKNLGSATRAYVKQD